MISRAEIESVCIAFTLRSEIVVSPQAVELISVILNALIEERQSHWPVQIEPRIRNALQENIPQLLLQVADHEGVKEELTAIDILHWLAPKLPESLRPIQALTFLFDYR